MRPSYSGGGPAASPTARVRRALWGTAFSLSVAVVCVLLLASLQSRRPKRARWKGTELSDDDIIVSKGAGSYRLLLLGECTRGRWGGGTATQAVVAVILVHRIAVGQGRG